MQVVVRGGCPPGAKRDYTGARATVNQRLRVLAERRPARTLAAGVSPIASCPVVGGQQSVRTRPACRRGWVRRRWVEAGEHLTPLARRHICRPGATSVPPAPHPFPRRHIRSPGATSVPPAPHRPAGVLPFCCRATICQDANGGAAGSGCDCDKTRASGARNAGARGTRRRAASRNAGARGARVSRAAARPLALGALDHLFEQRAVAAEEMVRVDARLTLGVEMEERLVGIGHELGPAAVSLDPDAVH